MRRDVFSGCHPAVNFLFFLLVLGGSMFLMHPAFLAVSLAGSLGYLAQLKGPAALKRGALFLLPMVLLAALVNPAFNHRGLTVLATLPTGNPLTLESILYGLAAGAMLGAVVAWCACFSVVMTADKLLFLFGRVLPALSLVVSMTLRFVPRFLRQAGIIAEGQRCLGRDVTKGPWKERLHTAVTILSILLTWSLESAIATADAMGARGYGLPGRTAFSLYRWEGRDRGLLVWLLVCGGGLVTAAVTGGLSWHWFPALGGTATGWTALGWGMYLALSLTPAGLAWQERRAWRRESRTPAGPLR